MYLFPTFRNNNEALTCHNRFKPTCRKIITFEHGTAHRKTHKMRHTCHRWLRWNGIITNRFNFLSQYVSSTTTKRRRRRHFVPLYLCPANTQSLWRSGNFSNETPPRHLFASFDMVTPAQLSSIRRPAVGRGSNSQQSS